MRLAALGMLCAVASSLRPSSRRRFVAGAAIAAPAAAAARDLQFKDLGDGLTVAQITEGRGDAVVRRDSVVLVELVGRLVGKQGWTFEDSRAGGDPYRLQLGRGEVVEGLERALVGARVGEVRRCIVPSRLAYVDPGWSDGFSSIVVHSRQPLRGLRELQPPRNPYTNRKLQIMLSRRLPAPQRPRGRVKLVLPELVHVVAARLDRVDVVARFRPRRQREARR